MDNELTVGSEGDSERRTLSTIEIAASRQAQEVQAMAIMAKKFPRDEVAAFTAIANSCKRVRLAEQSMYSYSRGGTLITGASIRLAETMARCWGNLDFGITELEQRHGESTVMAYCWDLQTNVRETKVFQVRHIRVTKSGSYNLTDPRDIYEATANQGARRLRACILGVIPGDIQDMAVEACEKTLAGASDKPLVDRVRDMVLAFQQFGVTQDMIEARLQHSIAATTIHEVVSLGKIFNSLRDNMSTREQWFQVAGPTVEPGKSKTEAVADEMAAGAKAPKKAPPKRRAKTTKKKDATTEAPAAEAPTPTATDTPVQEPEAGTVDKPDAVITVPESMADYYRRLSACVTAEEIRETWSEQIFAKKDTLSKEHYALGCQLRDVLIEQKAK